MTYKVEWQVVMAGQVRKGLMCHGAALRCIDSFIHSPIHSPIHLPNQPSTYCVPATIPNTF